MLHLKGKYAACQTEEDALILNSDDKNTVDQGKNKSSRKFYFSMSREVEEGVFLRNNIIVSRFNGKDKT